MLSKRKSCSIAISVCTHVAIFTALACVYIANITAVSEPLVFEATIETDRKESILMELEPVNLIPEPLPFASTLDADSIGGVGDGRGAGAGSGIRGDNSFRRIAFIIDGSSVSANWYDYARLTESPHWDGKHKLRGGEAYYSFNEMQNDARPCSPHWTNVKRGLAIAYSLIQQLDEDDEFYFVIATQDTLWELDNHPEPLCIKATKENCELVRRRSKAYLDHQSQDSDVPPFAPKLTLMLHRAKATHADAIIAIGGNRHMFRAINWEWDNHFADLVRYHFANTDTSFHAIVIGRYPFSGDNYEESYRYVDKKWSDIIGETNGTLRRHVGKPFQLDDVLYGPSLDRVYTADPKQFGSNRVRHGPTESSVRRRNERREEHLKAGKSPLDFPGDDPLKDGAVLVKE